jgi:hypothetical protein
VFVPISYLLKDISLLSSVLRLIKCPFLLIFPPMPRFCSSHALSCQPSYFDKTPPNTKEWFLKCRLCCCTQSECTPPEGENGWTDLIHIRFVAFIHHRSVPGEHEHHSSKNRGPADGPRKKFEIFSKMILVILTKFL